MMVKVRTDALLWTRPGIKRRRRSSVIIWKLEVKDGREHTQFW
jgi:hypothetical protein